MVDEAVCCGPDVARWDAVPQELREKKLWVCWRLEDRDGKRTKVPYDPCSGQRARTNDSRCWAYFEDAVREAHLYSGIGIVLQEGLCGVDLDHCRDPRTGDIEPWAREIIEKLDSYAEASPSGSGVHILLWGRLPAGRRRRGKVEVYGPGSPRYLTVTGDHLPGSPGQVLPREAELASVHAKHVAEEGQQETAGCSEGSAAVTSVLAPAAAPPCAPASDAEVLAKAMGARNGPEFSRLWAGGYPEDDSAGDLALCCHLVFWVGHDPERIDALFRCSGRFRAKWLREDYRQRTIQKALEAVREVHGQRPAASESAGPGATAPVLGGHRTELGMAERFAGMHRGRALYCHDLGNWLVWTCGRWEPDESGEAVAGLAKATVRTLYAEIAAITGDDEQTSKARSDLWKFAQSCEKERFLRAMLSLARVEPGMQARIGQFDADGWLLNCQNGVLDLRTGALRPHRPEYLCRRQVPVAFDPDATAPTWTRFLQDVMAGNEEMVEFLGRAVGASLPAHTREQVLLILHGAGANGKTTFMRTILALLGDYGAWTEPQTLLSRTVDEGVRNDLAALCGSRFVGTAETAAGKRLDEGLVKRLTGGDPVTARFLYREFFSFVPRWRTWLATNHRPEIRGTEHAIWRRIRLVPFDVVIPESRQDPELPDKLLAELSGILTWAVGGCLSWQQYGLAAPRQVAEATAAYREDEDVIGGFLRDCCEEGPGLQVASGELWHSYQVWCEREGERPLTRTALGRRLTQRGFSGDRVRRNGVLLRIWRGLGLSIESSC